MFDEVQNKLVAAELAIPGNAGLRLATLDNACQHMLRISAAVIKRWLRTPTPVNKRHHRRLVPQQEGRRF